MAAAWLVAMGGTVQAQAQTQLAPVVGALSAEYPFGFKAYGVFRRMITQRNYFSVVALKEATGMTKAGMTGSTSICARWRSGFLISKRIRRFG